MPNILPNSAKADLMSGNIDLDSAPIYCMLCTSSYVPSASHAKRSDVTNEVIGTGYTTGGVQLTGCTVTVAGGVAKFTANNPSWDNSTITARYAVIFQRVGPDMSTPQDDPLIAILDFGADVSSTIGTFTVQFNPSGIISLN